MKAIIILAITLTAVMTLVYVGFILLVAFNKPLLGTVIAPGLSIGILLGMWFITPPGMNPAFPARFHWNDGTGHFSTNTPLSHHATGPAFCGDADGDAGRQGVHGFAADEDMGVPGQRRHGGRRRPDRPHSDRP